MPYKDKEMKSQRQKERRLKPQSEAPVIPPPILYALTNPIKRKKLQDICKALEHRNLQSRLYYGCGDFSISFDIIEDLLEATRGK